MHLINLSKLQAFDLRVYDVSIEYYTLFRDHVLPNIPKSDIQLWTHYQCSKTTFFIEPQKNEYHLINNFFLINLLLMTNLNIGLNAKTVNLQSAKKVKAHEIEHLLFHELLFWMIRFKSLIDLPACHKQLKTLVSADMMQSLFGVDRLTVPIFLKIIGVSKNKYYRKDSH